MDEVLDTRLRVLFSENDSEISVTHATGGAEWAVSCVSLLLGWGVGGRWKFRNCQHTDRMNSMGPAETTSSVSLNGDEKRF